MFSFEIHRISEPVNAIKILSHNSSSETPKNRNVEKKILKKSTNYTYTINFLVKKFRIKRKVKQEPVKFPVAFVYLFIYFVGLIKICRMNGS